jgi:hypothetical protein
MGFQALKASRGISNDLTSKCMKLLTFVTLLTRRLLQRRFLAEGFAFCLRNWLKGLWTGRSLSEVSSSPKSFGSRNGQAVESETESLAENLRSEKLAASGSIAMFGKPKLCRSVGRCITPKFISHFDFEFGAV